MSRKSAKRAAGRSEDPRFVIHRGRIRQLSIDDEPPRNLVFDAIGMGLMALGQKVSPVGSIRVGSDTSD